LFGPWDAAEESIFFRKKQRVAGKGRGVAVSACCAAPAGGKGAGLPRDYATQGRGDVA